ncbi:acyl-CoA dehydrogenase family protein [Hephaestia sp. GCM10023244]|uniref:acyl-CoA dehydrogenase family protein n=1 Tax=unclassified Hephaestia TaxID=2631281 RepID=UPI0020772A91|nr:acyl-CoA dehydrogenase family protein [Hephaestia sp. MAHUQ-44]MCM8731609.1 hypothetical protein [Hephaestia sp. MAHUQ-44]
MLSDTGALLAEMTERFLAEQVDDRVMRAARAGTWPQRAWDAACAQGLPLALVQGEQGFDIPLDEGLALIRMLGRHAVPLPLAETMIANALLARAGLGTAEGPVALVPQCTDVLFQRQDGVWRATGDAKRIAWGRNASALLLEHDGRIGLATSGFSAVEHGTNLALMPRDQMRIDSSVTLALLPSITLIEAGAVIRTLAMAGALETLVALTIAHVSERVQFGRTLSAFQTVQHALAQLASEAASASAAADLAADAFTNASAHPNVAIAAARSRIAEAAGTAIKIAHQLHGAIGFTAEHRLHWFTTALWSWRDEFGSAAWWTRRLGVQALGYSKAAYWPFITSV